MHSILVCVRTKLFSAPPTKRPSSRESTQNDRFLRVSDGALQMSESLPNNGPLRERENERERAIIVTGSLLLLLVLQVVGVRAPHAMQSEHSHFLSPWICAICAAASTAPASIEREETTVIKESRVQAVVVIITPPIPLPKRKIEQQSTHSRRRAWR